MWAPWKPHEKFNHSVPAYLWYVVEPVLSSRPASTLTHNINKFWISFLIFLTFLTGLFNPFLEWSHRFGLYLKKYFEVLFGKFLRCWKGEKLCISIVKQLQMVVILTAEVYVYSILEFTMLLCPWFWFCHLTRSLIDLNEIS